MGAQARRRKGAPRETDRAPGSVFRPPRLRLQRRRDRRGVRDESLGGPSRDWPGARQTAARRARRIRPPSGRAADQSVALRRCFPGEWGFERDRAIRAGCERAQPLSWARYWPPAACGAGGLAPNRAGIWTAACAHPFVRCGRGDAARVRKKLRKGGGKRLKSLVRATLCARPRQRLRRARSAPGAAASQVCAAAVPQSSFASPSSPSVSLTRSTATTRSSAEVLKTITPCVDRPAILMPETGTRMSCPPSVTSMISSLSSTGNEATSEPLRSLTAMATIPLPPRPVTRYSKDELRLP